MRPHSLWLLLILLAFLSVFSGCSASSDDYFFENPTSLSVVKNVKCSDGTVSYIAFVTDNTDDYGARIMKISGCSAKIDKDFDDAVDGKTGLYIGGTGVSNDAIVVDGEIFIAVASSGYTEFEHWKDTDDSEKYEMHKGRVVFRKLNVNFKHDSLFDKSILLGFYPSIVKAYGSLGFFVSGSAFGTNYIGFIDLEGKSLFNEIDFTVGSITVAGGEAYLFDAGSGSVYGVDESLAPELLIKNESDSSVTTRGMTSIGNDRIAIFEGNNLTIYSSSLELVAQLTIPAGYQISSLSSVEYPESYEYRKFSNDNMSEKVQIYEYADEDSVDDTNDNADIEETDGDTVDAENSEDTENSGDIEISDDDSDSDGADVVYDAKDGDVLWIATTSGTVMAYDLKNGSWLVTSYTEDEADSNSDYYNEMRSYLSSSYYSFPKYGKTDADNMPRIREISAVRGLPSTVTYRFTYEGSFEGSYSEKGAINSEKNILSDSTADFSNGLIDPDTDSLILLNRNDTSECLIPWNENVIMDITEIISANEIGVSVENYSDQIEECFGDTLSYAVFPVSMYAVSREDSCGTSFAGRAVEYSAGYNGADISFSDGTVSVLISRTIDDVLTEKETSFYVKINPGVPFIGFSSADIMSEMSDSVSGRLLMFSSFTRRIIEYDIVNNETVEIYK